jgi:hypothetical protein
MTALDWRPLAGVDFARLREARVQAHYAVQWLARAARAYIPANPDDSHTNLGWEDSFGGFATHKVQGARLALKLLPLTLAIFEGTDPTPSRTFMLAGRKDADAHAWLGEEVGALGLDARKLDVEVPYRLPPHKVAMNGAYSLTEVEEGLRELAYWYSNASRSLGRVHQAMRANKFEVSPLRCWPHHFDYAALIAIYPPGETVEGARSIGVGLSPGDEHYNEPYFYVTPWPYPDRAKLPELPAIGRWHTQNFTAAVVPAHRILAAEARQATTEKFLAEALVAAVKALN